MKKKQHQKTIVFLIPIQNLFSVEKNSWKV